MARLASVLLLLAAACAPAAAGLVPREATRSALTPWCPAYPLSTDGRCGKLFGYARCPPGSCCSQWNWCSAADSPDPADKYCGAGCQLGYGQCTSPVSYNSSSTVDVFCRDPPAATGTWSLLQPTPTPVVPATLPSCPNYPTSTDGRCGKLFGFARCPTYDVGGTQWVSCCSEYNYCWDPRSSMGQRASYCGKGCQLGYGGCDDNGTMAVIPCRLDIAPTAATPTYTFITAHATSTAATCAPTCFTTVLSTVTVTVSASTSRPTTTTSQVPPTTNPPTTTKTAVPTTSRPSTTTLTVPTTNRTTTTLSILTSTTSGGPTTTSTLTLPPDFGTQYVTATFRVDTSYPTSLDGRCGPDYGNTRCGNNTRPGCCSGDSTCFFPPVNGTFNDTAVALGPCGIGCQQNFGICFAAFVRRGQECGPGIGSCPANICCGGSGFCEDSGATDGPAWCGCDCQRGYGKCFEGYGPEVCNATFTTTSTATPTPTGIVMPDLNIPTANNLRCGIGEGNGLRCPNNLCCSAASFCQNDGGNDGFPWCGCGCQFGFGKCFLYEPNTCPGQETSATTSLTVLPYPTATSTADASLPVSTNGRCGSVFGTRCPDGICCSAGGFCQNDGGNDGFEWCGCGCQQRYGKCFLYAPGDCDGLRRSFWNVNRSRIASEAVGQLDFEGRRVKRSWLSRLWNGFVYGG
ncbi:hypothetical protein DFJ74DRAFT_217576 [Hyaloraphidium curvatum]|nr:hypothetical protein DFJ74DRAFT_217576 [Hyaloraphidium curvatum]